MMVPTKNEKVNLSVKNFIAAQRIPHAILIEGESSEEGLALAEFLATVETLSDKITLQVYSADEDGANELEMMNYYKGLISMRKTYPIFTTVNTAMYSSNIGTNGAVAITYDNHMGGKANIIANPTAEAITYDVTGTWYMVVDGKVVTVENPAETTGTITIPAYSAVVLVNQKA